MGGGILFEIQLIQLFVYLTKKGPQGQEEKSWMIESEESEHFFIHVQYVI